MRIPLDTRIFLWAVSTPERLDEAARKAILSAGNEVLFSAASIWEIAIKAGLRRADFVADPNVVVEEASDLGFIELPVRSAAAARVADLPPIHRDPFDRLLVAPAIEEPAVLYTADEQLLGYSDLVKRAGAP